MQVPLHPDFKKRGLGDLPCVSGDVESVMLVHMLVSSTVCRCALKTALVMHPWMFWRKLAPQLDASGDLQLERR